MNVWGATSAVVYGAAAEGGRIKGHRPHSLFLRGTGDTTMAIDTEKAKAIMAQRTKQYGPIEPNLERLGHTWAGLIEQYNGLDAGSLKVPGELVGVILVAFKLFRLVTPNVPYNANHGIDAFNFLNTADTLAAQHIPTYTVTRCVKCQRTSVPLDDDLCPECWDATHGEGSVPPDVPTSIGCPNINYPHHIISKNGSLPCYTDKSGQLRCVECNTAVTRDGTKCPKADPPATTHPEPLAWGCPSTACNNHGLAAHERKPSLCAYCCVTAAPVAL